MSTSVPSSSSLHHTPRRATPICLVCVDCADTAIDVGPSRWYDFDINIQTRSATIQSPGNLAIDSLVAAHRCLKKALLTSHS